MPRVEFDTEPYELQGFDESGIATPSLLSGYFDDSHYEYVRVSFCIGASVEMPLKEVLKQAKDFFTMRGSTSNILYVCIKRRVYVFMRSMPDVEVATIENEVDDVWRAL